MSVQGWLGIYGQVIYVWEDKRKGRYTWKAEATGETHKQKAATCSPKCACEWQPVVSQVMGETGIFSHLCPTCLFNQATDTLNE